MNTIIVLWHIREIYCRCVSTNNIPSHLISQCIQHDETIELFVDLLLMMINSSYSYHSVSNGKYWDPLERLRVDRHRVVPLIFVVGLGRYLSIQISRWKWELDRFLRVSKVLECLSEDLLERVSNCESSHIYSRKIARPREEEGRISSSGEVCW